VVTENKKEENRPAIYIGDTEFARVQGILQERFEGWSYRFRVTGEDLIISGSSEGERQGVVKGVCDFLREYAGVRFLYPGRTGIEFLDMPVITVPSGLDHAVTPMLQFSSKGDRFPEEWLYNIANNHFPEGFEMGGHMWEAAIPAEKYYDRHPEYFALVDGKRIRRKGYEQYCIANPRVPELIVEYMVDLAADGRKVLVLAQPDAFTPCECEECYKLYGTGDDWDEKVWLFHDELTRRFQEKAPGTKVLMLSYQATTHPPKSIKKLPEHTMVWLSHTYDEALKEWIETEVEVPDGFVLNPKMFGSHTFTNYLPKRTPDWLESKVKDFHHIDMDVVGLLLFGGIDAFGLAGPAYYVFGRMFDDPENNGAEELEEEFYTAAFGESVVPMREFYTILHDNLGYFSWWLAAKTPTHFRMGLDRKPWGVDDQLDWVRVPTQKYGARGMHRGITDPGQVLSIVFTPEMVLQMEQALEKAEGLAADPTLIKRLKLVRMQFDYLKQVSTINHLYNAWKIDPEPAALDRLLAEVDDWNEMLDSLYDDQHRMKPIQGWPELIPFRGINRSSLGLISARWWRDKPAVQNPFAWNTEEMRAKL